VSAEIVYVHRFRLAHRVGDCLRERVGRNCDLPVKLLDALRDIVSTNVTPRSTAVRITLSLPPFWWLDRMRSSTPCQPKPSTDTLRLPSLRFFVRISLLPRALFYAAIVLICNRL
jgi:hypothetical protein